MHFCLQQDDWDWGSRLAKISDPVVLLIFQKLSPCFSVKLTKIRKALDKSGILVYDVMCKDETMAFRRCSDERLLPAVSGLVRNAVCFFK